MKLAPGANELKIDVNIRALASHHVKHLNLLDATMTNGTVVRAALPMMAFWHAAAWNVFYYLQWMVQHEIVLVRINRNFQGFDIIGSNLYAVSRSKKCCPTRKLECDICP